MEVRRNIRKEIAGSTILIVSQRIVTVVDADKIIVISDGKIIDSGTHDELMKRCDLYREMANLQEYEVEQ